MWRSSAVLGYIVGAVRRPRVATAATADRGRSEAATTQALDSEEQGCGDADRHGLRGVRLRQDVVGPEPDDLVGLPRLHVAVRRTRRIRAVALVPRHAPRRGPVGGQ